MKRSWIGLALLSASWLFGLSYYHDAQWLAWSIIVLAGTALLIGANIRPAAPSSDGSRWGLRPTALESMIAALLLLPAIDLAPWPYRIAPIFIFVGLGLSVVPIPRRWPGACASALILGGIILLAQSLAILGYEYVTARSHELSRPLSYLLCAVSRLLGFRAALDGTNLALFSPRLVHLLGATWELLLDPATLSFLVGGIVILCLLAPVTQWHGLPARGNTAKMAVPPGKQRLFHRLAVRLGTPYGALVILTIGWLFVRAALLISIYMHRALRTGYEEELALMEQFWNPWFLSAFLLGPVLLSLRFFPGSAWGRLTALPTPSGVQPASSSKPAVKLNKLIGATVLTIVGSFMLIIGLFLDMPGRRKAGRVLIDEYHSTWEPTGRPYDTEWYGHDSGYNFACIYDYCTRFYDMGRLETPLDDAAIADCDVLIVKVPTSRYTPEEISAIERFVERGGGLMLMGEHTTVFNTGTHLNDIAKVFGFSFRYDCLFEIDTKYEQLYKPPLVPHPIIQNMPPMNFAVSCSIRPGTSLGRAAIRSRSLKNLLADYHASNYYPQVVDKAEMRYGAFVQLWTARRGAGRIVAFTDSTIFSNFATFEPGKAELMLGMLEWLNFRNRSLFGDALRCFNPQPFLIFLGILLLVVVLALCRRCAVRRPRRKASPSGQAENVFWLIVVCAGLFGWAAAVVSARAIHQYSMPVPKTVRPMVKVVLDRTVCDAPLPTSGFIGGKREGFGIFERWILRLGYFTSRKKGTDAFSGDVLVFTHPNLTVTSEFRSGLLDYVQAGGKVLILDSPENTKSTANSLLYPFGLNVNRSTRIKGQLKVLPGGTPYGAQGWPRRKASPSGVIKIDSAFRIESGEPIMSVSNATVAARAHHGKGTVTVIGFGSRFVDANMGVTGDVVPNDELRKVFDLHFMILKAIVSEP